jgi:hypothetical protein
MKEMDASKKESELIAKKRENRRKKFNEKIGNSANNNVEIEREFRKLATKGGSLIAYWLHLFFQYCSLFLLCSVVALFNAVAKAKRDSNIEEMQKKKKFSDDESTVFSPDEPSKRIVGHKSWKVVSDEQVPLVSFHFREDYFVFLL